ncbi:MAG: hypothetical protein KF791_07845 [Verrucomicrobiae bacterium]|nr:hypothetical protein [Verrucomicrobiae bacterium]
MPVPTPSSLARIAGLLAAFAVVPTVGAINAGSPDNPYGVITNRNAFGIRPPPEPDQTPPPPPPPAPPPNVFLTGVSHERGIKKAYFVVNRPGAKSPDYETAREGEEIQDLKVQEILPREGKVRVLVGGREVVLNFKDNGMKSAAGAVPVQAPGGRPGTPTPQPVAPVPQPAAQSGPVVIGRGGVNLSDPGLAAAPAVFPGAVAAGQQGGIPVQMPAMDPGTVTAPRTLPARALSRGAPILNQEPSAAGIPETGGVVGSGGVPIPVPPPSRFAP